MSQGRVVSLSVHRNTVARRRAKFLREEASHAARLACDSLPEAHGFVGIAIRRDGGFHATYRLPDGIPLALLRAVMAEAAEGATVE